MLDAELETARRIADEVRRRGVRWVFLAARGSSDHAAIYGQYLFQIENGLPAGLAAPSVFTRYRAPVALENVLVIGVSQSGEAPDVLETLAVAEKRGALTVGVTNSPDSPLATQPHFVIHCHAGLERSVAATKTYLNSLAAFLLLASALGPRSAELSGSLRALPESVEAALASESAIADHVERYRYMEECVTLSRGLHLCTAMEAALKLTETCMLISRPFSAADFLHGPFALAGDGFPCLVFLPPGPCREDVLELHAKLIGAGAETLAFTLGEDAPADATVAFPIPCANPAEALAPFLHTVAAQLFAYHLSITRGLDPDRPRGLRKITHTR
jgi:glucosamine--fructose-6-phosphate aminotransferase (isomerizing)